MKKVSPYKSILFLVIFSLPIIVYSGNRRGLRRSVLNDVSLKFSGGINYLFSEITWNNDPDKKFFNYDFSNRLETGYTASLLWYRGTGTYLGLEYGKIKLGGESPDPEFNYLEFHPTMADEFVPYPVEFITKAQTISAVVYQHLDIYNGIEAYIKAGLGGAFLYTRFQYLDARHRVDVGPDPLYVKGAETNPDVPLLLYGQAALGINIPLSDRLSFFGETGSGIFASDLIDGVPNYHPDGHRINASALNGYANAGVYIHFGDRDSSTRNKRGRRPAKRRYRR